MSTRSYILALSCSLALVGALLLGTGCGGSSEPPEVPPALLALCQSELVRLGATPANAEALCKAGGDALLAEFARLREQASAASVPCAPVGVGGGGS